MSVNLPKVKIGFIPANRGFFSSELAKKMRNQTVEVMQKMGLEVVVPDPSQTEVGCVGNLREASVCAKLFREAAVDGILISAVNFGEEQAAAMTVREAGLNVPIMIVGCQEEETLRMTTPRRDSFCGLLSIGECLRQIGVRYSVATTPIGFPTDVSFRQDLDWFARVCRVVNGVRRARYGQVGARPEAFWTCRFDEKQLQRLGPTVVVLDLSEAIGGASKLKDDDAQVKERLRQIHAYADTSAVVDPTLVKIAKLEVFLRRWREDNQINAMAIQCWTSIQQNYGSCTCTIMSRLGDEGVPCACEADILGTMSMHAAMLASGNAAGLADWNNLHNEDSELVNIWHCGVFPKAFAKEQPKLGVQEIIASGAGVPREDAMGVVEFVAKPGPLTLARVTQDGEGANKVVLAEGAFEDNPAKTFGGYGWCRIKNLDRLYREVLLNHFPHHVAITHGHAGNVLWEAMGNYLGFKTYHATQATPGLYTPSLPF